MRCFYRAGLAALVAGWLMVPIQSAIGGALSGNPQGTWTGTYTPLTSPMPLSLTSAGTTAYSAPPVFFNPTPIQFIFGPSSKFDFSADFSRPSDPGYFLPVTQTAGFVLPTGLFEVMDNFYVTLSDGTKSLAGTELFSGTISTDASNKALDDLSGTWVVLPTVTALPSNAVGTATTFTADFSLTGPAMTPVPLPAALWSSLSLLGGLGCIWFVRRKRATLK